MKLFLCLAGFDPHTLSVLSTHVLSHGDCVPLTSKHAGMQFIKTEQQLMKKRTTNKTKEIRQEDELNLVRIQDIKATVLHVIYPLVTSKRQHQYVMSVLVKLLSLVCKRIAQSDLLLQNPLSVPSLKGEEVHCHVWLLFRVMEFFKRIWHSEQTEDCKISCSYKVQEGAVSSKVPESM